MSSLFNRLFVTIGKLASKSAAEKMMNYSSYSRSSSNKASYDESELNWLEKKYASLEKWVDQKLSKRNNSTTISDNDECFYLKSGDESEHESNDKSIKTRKIQAAMILDRRNDSGKDAVKISVHNNACTMITQNEFYKIIEDLSETAGYDILKKQSDKKAEFEKSIKEDLFYRKPDYEYIRIYDTVEKICYSYYLRIRDLNEFIMQSCDYVETEINHLVRYDAPDDLKYNSGYIYRKEVEDFAGPDGVIYIGNKCVGRIIKSRCYEDRFDIIIKEGTDAIADCALADSCVLCSVTLPDSVVVIGVGAFERNHALTKVQLSKSLRYIKSAAFRFCWELENIELPSGLCYIGPDAFRKCESLTSLKIPDSVEYIGSKAFYKCKNLKSVVLPSGIRKISSGMFRYCRALTEIKIPKNVISIEKEAFADCNLLENVILPSGLKRIEKAAFSGCIKLKYIHIPDSVEFMDDDIFGSRKRYIVILCNKGSYSERYALRNGISSSHD